MRQRILAAGLCAALILSLSAMTVSADPETTVSGESTGITADVPEEGRIEADLSDENVIEEEPVDGTVPEEQTSGGIPEWAVDEETEPPLFDAYVLPYRFDMREYGWVTPVKLQNPWGSCWAFGSTAAAESSLLSSLDLTAAESGLDLSERHLVCNAFKPITELENPSQAGEGLYPFSDDVNAPYDAGGFSVMLSALYASGAGPLEEAYYPYWGRNAWTIADTIDQYVDDYISDQAAEGGITEEEYLAKVMAEHGFTTEQQARDYLASYLLENMLFTYSKYDDWSIPATTESGQSTRNLSEGFVLKNSNLIPDYRTEDGEVSEDAVRIMKQEMINGRAIAIGYCADQTKTYVATSDFSTDGRYGENVYGGIQYAQYIDEAKPGNHEVCIVGWDDNFASTNFNEGHQPPGNGAWIVKNSWGSKSDAAPDANGNIVNEVKYGAYNEEGKPTGYFYLSYYDKSIESDMETFEFSSNLAGNDSFGVYQYDYLAAVDGYFSFMSTDVLSTANVFTSELEADLLSISARCPGTNLRVIYAVYLLNEDAADPSDGEMVYKGSVNYECGGFHRIDLDQPVHLQEGQKFSVITTCAFVEPDGSRSYGISTSRAYDQDTCAAWGYTYYAKSVINEGESYYYTADTWSDWSETAEDIVARTKAQYGQGIVLDNFSIKAYVTPSESEKIDISSPVIKGIENKTYTGKPITQEFTVTVGGAALTEDTDYTTSYSNNTKIGTATVTITGINRYTGSDTRTFKIIPEGTSLTTVTGGSRQFTANWKKQTKQTTGYLLQYSTSKDFPLGNRGARRITSNKTLSATVKKLESGKNYYVRIRTYKLIDGRYYYSKWSEVKKVKTK